MQATNNSDSAGQPVAKLLPRFAVPCVLSMLVSALYNMVEQIFIGQSVGYLGNAATNVVYPFTVIALALALLVGMAVPLNCACSWAAEIQNMRTSVSATESYSLGRWASC